MGKAIIEGFRCERCQHTWIPRSDRIPAICPKCKSPYWNRPRVKGAHSGKKSKA